MGRVLGRREGDICRRIVCERGLEWDLLLFFCLISLSFYDATTTFFFFFSFRFGHSSLPLALSSFVCFL